MRIKVILSLSSCCLILIGCTVHRFERSQKLGGYAVARFGYVIPEYTVDLNNKAPEDFSLARARYLRRNDTVETYYIRMGQIESYGRRYLTHFPRLLWSLFANTLKMPFHIVSEYKYEHNEKYRQRIDALDALQKAEEDSRIARLKSGLMDFIAKDLEKEAKSASINVSP